MLVLGDDEVMKADPGSFSSLHACERSMDSPCGFPGPAHALADTIEPAGRAQPKKIYIYIKKGKQVQLAALQRALPTSGWTNKYWS